MILKIYLQRLYASRFVQKKSKTFVCLGDIFLQLPTTEVIPILEDDQKKLEDEILKLRDDLKPKMQKLRQLEKKPELKGFDLKPLAASEMHMITWNSASI